MKPFYQDNHNTLYCLDFRKNELPDECVQMVCTSPPYWGLRKYSGEQELIWGDKDCEHQWGELLPCHHPGQVTDAKAVHNETTAGETAPSGQFCSLCGAWKGAYGLEPTPEMYIEHTIEILREIRRVLRKDGVVFWNIGDSYYTHSGGYYDNPNYQGESFGNPNSRVGFGDKPKHKILKPKDLCLIPFRVAIAAQEDGWHTFSVCIWSKKNPMPESTTRRPTTSHEYILIMAKTDKHFWDADAVREVANYDGRHDTIMKPSGKYSDRNIRNEGANPNSVHTRGAERWPSQVNGQPGRNIRSVWEFPTQPYPEAHFAVFPEKLPEICIKAATPEVGCCSKCGALWERITKVSRSNESYWGKQGKTPEDVKSTGKYGDALASDGDRKRAGSDIRLGPTISVETLGWQPTCKCNADKVPSIVLDSFMGAGTTLWVAKRLNRKAIGYELSEEYCELALERNRQQILL